MMRKALLGLLAWLALTSAALATTTCASVPNTFVNGTTIDAPSMNANFTALLFCFNNNVAENGTNTSITKLGGLTAPPSGAGSLVFAGSTVAGTNTITVGVTNPVGFFLQTGAIILFQPANTNTGAVTLAVGASAATAVTKQSPSGPVALVGGEIVAGQLVAAEYDGTQYEILSDSAIFIAPAFTNPTANTQALSDNTTLLATDAFARGVAAQIGPVRQTVAQGPINTNGTPNFFSATYANLNPSTVNVSSGTPFVVHAAGGWLNTGPNNLFGASTTNLTWTGITASNTDYLYVVVAANGTLTTGFTTLAPIYQYNGTPSVTAGQFTFNTATMTGFLGNGSTAPQTYAVFVGEMVTSGSAVTSTIAYAYNGYYDSGYTTTLPNASTTTTFNSNLGCNDATATFSIQNVITNGNYSVGDIAYVLTQASATYSQGVGLNRNTAWFANGASSYNILNKTTQAGFTPTAADWAYRMVVKRNW